jgi:hypothetical protein
MKKILFFTLIAFITSSCSTSLSQKEIEEYTEKGKEIAGTTANSLMKNLSEKMEKGGIAEAVPFCNTMAHPLTDEMANKYDASIKRTSLYVRNKKNEPNQAEIKILNQFETSFSNKEPLKPVVTLDESGKPHFYGPILLQKKCLACHGTVGEEVNIKTDSIIKSYYPNDKATGFKEGDLRGIWSITFNTNK